MKQNLVLVLAILLIFSGCQTKEEKAIELHKESLRLIEENKLDQAEKNLDQALDIGTMNARVLEAKLTLYQKQNNREKLETTATSLLALNPLNNVAIEIVSHSYLRNENPIQALEVLSYGRSDSNQSLFDTTANILIEGGKIGDNSDLTVKKFYDLLLNRHGKYGKVMATGVALHQLLDLTTIEKYANEVDSIFAIVEEKLPLLEVNVDFNTFEAIASGYKLAASSAYKEYETPKELISGTFWMDAQVSSIQSHVSSGKIQMGSSEIRKKIFLHKIISNKLLKLKKTSS